MIIIITKWRAITTMESNGIGQEGGGDREMGKPSVLVGIDNLIATNLLYLPPVSPLFYAWPLHHIILLKLIFRFNRVQSTQLSRSIYNHPLLRSRQYSTQRYNDPNMVKLLEFTNHSRSCSFGEPIKQAAGLLVQVGQFAPKIKPL